MDLTLKKVNKTYKEVNPSNYLSKINKKNISKLERQRKTLFHSKLHLPIDLFKDKKLLDLGSGTGIYSIIYNLWGSDCTLVEFDKKSFIKSKKIFHKFQRKNSNNNFYNKDIFKFQGKFLYDIVHCNGVLHHTSKKNLGIKLMAANLKKGGILILGASIITGFFQRNLQRYLLYRISKNKKEIIENSKKYFGQHLKRAAKGSGRSVLAIIYDTYINYKIDSFSLKNLLKTFEKNKIEFYSSFPSINYINDADMEWKHYSGNNPHEESIDFTNLIWFSRNRSFQNQEFKNYCKNILFIANTLNNISYENRNNYFQKIKKIKKKVDVISDVKNIGEERLFGSKHFYYFNELKILIDILLKNKKKDLKYFLKKTKYLFKGYSGIGMNYFIGFKK
jgi:2-polyprenyl-3-methyl-5-hydroxy-6-metoxy-1,4-benzoquinol methylase